MDAVWEAHPLLGLAGRHGRHHHRVEEPPPPNKAHFLINGRTSALKTSTLLSIDAV